MDERHKIKLLLDALFLALTLTHKLELLLDALFLALTLTHKLSELDRKGLLVKDHRLFRIAGKAWERYNRRTDWFPEIRRVGFSWESEGRP